MTTFANKLKSARLSAVISQKELASRANTTPALISRYEQGKSIPRAETIAKIASVLGVPMQDLQNTREYLSFSDTSLIEIPLFESKLMGIDRVDILDRIQSQNSKRILFDISSLKKHAISPNDVFLFTCAGDSMEPAINDSDLTLIDPTNTSIKDGLIYLFVHGGLLRIKRLFQLPNNKIRINSFNSSNYPDEMISNDEIEIIGKIVWIGGFR